jgi:conjugal transfer/entry exclusion protein
MPTEIYYALSLIAIFFVFAILLVSNHYFQKRNQRKLQSLIESQLTNIQNQLQIFSATFPSQIQNQFQTHFQPYLQALKEETIARFGQLTQVLERRLGDGNSYSK